MDLASPKGELIEIWDLPDQESVELNVRVVIGFDGTNYEEVFDTCVITGLCIRKYDAELQSIPYDGKVFRFHRFASGEIKHAMVSAIQACHRPTVDECIHELRKIMFWDFEGL